MPTISIIIPVYQAETSLGELNSRLTKTLNRLIDTYEVIMVDDGSTDKSWYKIQTLSKKNSALKGILLSKNFGQHYAIAAGLNFALGNLIVVMDCDLQDQPEEIERLYEKIQEGYDIVLARRLYREHSRVKQIFSTVFYKLFDFLTDSETDKAVANFGMYKRIVIDNFVKMHEQNIFFPASIKWLGFSVGYIDVRHGKTTNKRSAYTYIKLFTLAANTIVSHSNKPLKLFILFGFIISLSSFAYGLYVVIRYFMYRTPVVGWTSLISSIYFLGGLIFTGMGILGIYIGKIFDEVKNRPLYVIKEKINV